jgi:hypothetical protein
VRFSNWPLLSRPPALPRTPRRARPPADGENHRRSLAEHSPYLLDQTIGVVTASTLVARVLYHQPRNGEKFHTEHLLYTVPFRYGIFRYLYLVHQREGGGNCPGALTDGCRSRAASGLPVVPFYGPAPD